MKFVVVIPVLLPLAACFGPVDMNVPGVQIPHEDIIGVPVDEARVQTVYKAAVDAAKAAALPGVATALPPLVLDVTDKFIKDDSGLHTSAIVRNPHTGFVQITVSLIDSVTGQPTTDIAHTSLCHALVEYLAGDFDGSRYNDPALYGPFTSIEARCVIATAN